MTAEAAVSGLTGELLREFDIIGRWISAGNDGAWWRAETGSGNTGTFVWLTTSRTKPLGELDLTVECAIRTDGPVVRVEIDITDADGVVLSEGPSLVLESGDQGASSLRVQEYAKAVGQYLEENKPVFGAYLF